jgi:hypothetical protein
MAKVNQALRPGTTAKDPIVRLSAAVLLAAVDDLRSDDPVKALTCLCWWLGPDPGVWLDACGMGEIPTERVIFSLKRGVHGHKKNQGETNLHPGG